LQTLFWVTDLNNQIPEGNGRGNVIQTLEDVTLHVTGVKILCYHIKHLLSNKMAHVKVKMHSTHLFMSSGLKISKPQKNGGGGCW